MMQNQALMSVLPAAPEAVQRLAKGDNIDN